MFRRHVNKRRSAKQFRRHSRHTKAANIGVARGGIRL
jgi:hypothetical protein